MGGFKRLSRESRGPPGAAARPRNGWGVAYYPGGRLYAVREFGDAHTSVHYDEVSHMASSNPDARVLLAHLWASPSRPLLGRTERLEPLSGRDGAGKEWLFAFDGRVGKDRRTGESFAPDPLRQLASEKVFAAVLNNLHGQAGPEAVRAVIKAALDGVAAGYEYGSLNMALTDGTAVHLARYVDDDADWNGVWYSKLARATIGCSEALGTVEQKWEPLGNRMLLVFDPAQNMQMMKL